MITVIPTVIFLQGHIFQKCLEHYYFVVQIFWKVVTFGYPVNFPCKGKVEGKKCV